MISAAFYTNGFGVLRHTNALSLKTSTICTVIECIALAILGGCIGFYFHPHSASILGISICSSALVADISLFCFINRQNLFFGGLPIQRRLHVDPSTYEVETVELTIDHEPCYFYGKFLNPIYMEWQSSRGNMSFQDFIDNKISTNSAFKIELMSNKLRLLTEEERERVKVHFDDGRLMQIGLDVEGHELSVLPEGDYIFVLQKKNDRKELYVAKKELTPKGRVQHCSFFHHDTIRSAGVITINDEGRISDVVMLSGHFLPTRENIPVIEKYMKKKIPERYYSFDISLPASCGI